MSFLRNPGTNSIRYVREHTGYLGLLLEGEMEKQSWLIVTARDRQHRREWDKQLLFLRHSYVTYY